MSSQKIIDALQKGVITIVFEKIGTGEIRIMPCTLKNEVHKQSVQLFDDIYQRFLEIHKLST